MSNAGWRATCVFMFTSHRPVLPGLNMVERFFRDLTQNRLKQGVFRDLNELLIAVQGYIDRHNQKPKPVIWTASARDILEKVTRARRTLDNAQSV